MGSSVNKIRIATRQSALALWQTHHVREQLRKHYPNLIVEIVGITTTGDRVLDRPLAEVGGKALFVKELESALLNNTADIAVHSIKDVPAQLDDVFQIPAILEREDPRDVLLSVKYPDVMSLPDNARLGTSSFRRKAQIMALRPDLNILNLRGNVGSRIKKLLSDEYDAIILAYAGLKRLHLTQYIRQVLPVAWFLPAAGQGAIGVECLADNAEIISLLRVLNHLPTAQCVIAERSMNQFLQGDCYSPIGSYAQIRDEQLHLQGLVASPRGEHVLRTSQHGAIEQAAVIGEAAAIDLLKQGAKALLCHP